jgi:hypothetical protein
MTTLLLEDQPGGIALVLRDQDEPPYYPTATVGAARVEIWTRPKTQGVDAAVKVGDFKPGSNFDFGLLGLSPQDVLIAAIPYSASNVPAVSDLNHAEWIELNYTPTIDVDAIISGTVSTGDVDATGDGSFGGDMRAVGKVVAEDGLAVGNSANAATPGTVIKKIEIFNAAGASIGFVAVYDDIT